MDVFDQHLQLLWDLFPTQINKQKKRELRNIFENTENSWNANKNRFSDKEIKYLLICEAPPDSGNYFYNNFDKPLFSTVWKTFFNLPKCKNSKDAYQCLADIGFLLIDTLPYSMNYGNHRFNPQYYRLINSCLSWWLGKLIGLNLSKDLKIAFGYNQNALNVMIALSLKKNNNPLLQYLPLTPEQIAQSSAGQPTSKRLVEIFEVKTKFHCKCQNQYSILK